MLTGGYSRVTNTMMTNTFIRDIHRNLSTIDKLQRQISTGKKIQYPSDDPVGADRALDYRQTVNELDQYSKNVDDANTLASNIDTVFQHMEDLLLRVRDLAVRASNEAPQNQANRDTIADEINSLLSAMVSQANQKFDGKYLFSGLKTGTTPFEAKTSITFNYTTGAGGNMEIEMPSTTIEGTTTQSDAITDTNSVKAVLVNGQNYVTALGGSYTVDPTTNIITLAGGPALNDSDVVELRFDKVVSVDYNGDMATREVEISEGTTVKMSYAGAVSNDANTQSVFGKYSGEGTDMASVEAFQKMMQLRDNIYKYGNGGTIDDIMKGIDDIDDVRETITNARSEQGGRVNRLELAKNRIEQMNIYTSKILSDRENVDMAEAISELVLAQNIYQASLQSGAKIIQTTLLDFLR